MADDRRRLVSVKIEQELVTEICPSCGILFAWPADFHRAVSKSGGAHRGYCPNGHIIQWAKSEADEVREQLQAERLARQRAEQKIAEKEDWAKMWEATANDQRDRAEKERNRANGYKGHATRMTKRAKAGVCPCCNRTFKQLAAHMANKHPEFTPMELEQGVSLQ